MLLIGIKAMSSSLFSLCSSEFSGTYIGWNGVTVQGNSFPRQKFRCYHFSICLSTIRMLLTHLLRHISAAQRHPAFFFFLPKNHVLSCKTPSFNQGLCWNPCPPPPSPTIIVPQPSTLFLSQKLWAHIFLYYFLQSCCHKYIIWLQWW